MTKLTKGMRTYFPKAKEINKRWYLIDAEGQSLGRLATEVAKILQGKNKASYCPNLDTGDYVIVTNLAKLDIDQKKAINKVYYRHSGYPGGIKAKSLQQYFSATPEKLFRQVVWGMMPKNRLGRKMMKKLKVYSSEQHKHNAQKPTALTIRRRVNA